MYKLNSNYVVLECMECGEIVVVSNEEFVKIFKNDEIITENEILLSDILDEILDEDDYTEVHYGC